MRQRYGGTPARALRVRVLALALALAASIMSSIDFSSPAAAQANGAPTPAKANGAQLPRDEERYKAPIGHRQPRPRDLPPDVVRDEDRSVAVEKELDKGLEICRNCIEHPTATQRSVDSAVLLDAHKRLAPKKRLTRRHPLGL
jgi:hypothetical protein